MQNKSVIPGRIAAALSKFPPFSMMSQYDTAVLAEEAEVLVMAQDDFVWQQGDAPGSKLHFLAKGRVEYLWKQDGREELVDVRDEGDLLGLTAMIESEPFRVSAKVAEYCIFYTLDWQQLDSILQRNDQARAYTRRHLFWSTRVGRSVSLPAPLESQKENSILQAHLAGVQRLRLRPKERLLWCSPDTAIFEAAEEMVSRKLPSILVLDDDRKPLGIVSHSNIVRNVVVGSISKTQPVSDIMTSPVVTVEPYSNSTEVILLMLRKKIGQVCITEDGTINAEVLDVCTDKDLLSQSGHNPAGLMSEIRNIRSFKRFREICDDVEQIAISYLDAGISASFLGRICAEIYDALAMRFTQIAIDELKEQGEPCPDVPWSWISVGSDGRREQVLRTDMDNALVFRSLGDRDQDETHRSFFLRLATRVIDLFVSCGFSRCQGGVMAMNPKWCRTDTEWIEELGSIEPMSSGERVLRALVLYDMRFVCGDSSLVENLRDVIFKVVSERESWQRVMAEQVVETAVPLNFFGKFVVEKRGDHEGRFDLKSRGIAPLRDAARLLVLKHNLKRRYSTEGRWDDLKNIEKYDKLAKLAQESCDFMLRLRLQNGIKQKDSGKFIEPKELTKLEKTQLANAFDVVRMVQGAIRLEFALDLK
ncbi:DUF294 nucleotidyltransferase-like domain-containing protein [Puniceicoccaceae bacterium K14]|nr:DUF294 nucleotidyltransferase-like domain-containing protein [Puniceicoccaceae bacterium K14]